MNLKINYRTTSVLGQNNINLFRTSLLLPSLREARNIKLPRIPIIEEDTIIEKIDIEPKEDIIIEEPKKVIPNQKLIALTFDDGPSKYTEDILEILKNTNSKATFFITGNNIKGNEETLKKIDILGHQIGLHGFSHIPFTDMNLDDINIEIATTFNMLYDIGVNATPIVRPPFGKLNEDIKEKINSPFVLWNIDPEDWKYQDKDYIKKTILDNITDGSIIVLHDMYKSSVEAVKEVIEELQKQGYTFTTIDDMYHRYSINLRPGRIYTKIYK